MDHITIRISSKEDFKCARTAIKNFKSKIGTLTYHQERYDQTGRWLTGHSIPINGKTMLHFFVAADTQEQSHQGYLEFMEYLK